MSGATEDRKDQLAARALSRLREPQLPEGFAARIAARATSAPQASATPREILTATDSEPLPTAGIAPPDSLVLTGWRRYAVASVAALAVAAVGLFMIGAGSQAQRRPEVVADGQPARSSQFTSERTVEVANGTPALAPPARASVRIGKTEPVLQLPVAIPSQPDELMIAGEPMGSRVQDAVTGKEEKLVQIGPPAGPQDIGGSRPVFGPPVPQGLGIAGSINSLPSLPGEMGATGRTTRGSPPGGPSAGAGSTIPSAATPRGSGPHI